MRKKKTNSLTKNAASALAKSRWLQPGAKAQAAKRMARQNRERAEKLAIYPHLEAIALIAERIYSTGGLVSGDLDAMATWIDAARAAGWKPKNNE